MLYFTIKNPENIFDFDLDVYDTLSVEVRVKVNDGGNKYILQCPAATYCTITYGRSCTALVYYLSPRVVYYSSDVSIYVDPRSAVSTNPNLPFDDARIDDVGLSFAERGVDSTTTLASGKRNQVKGLANNEEKNLDADFMMLFGSSEADNYIPTMTMCLPTGTGNCYSARTVPVIASPDFDYGYTTGFQKIVIKGYGFGVNQYGVSVTVDGVPCDISDNVKNTKIVCITRPSTESVITGKFY